MNRTQETPRFPETLPEEIAQIFETTRKNIIEFEGKTREIAEEGWRTAHRDDEIVILQKRTREGSLLTQPYLLSTRKRIE